MIDDVLRSGLALTDFWRLDRGWSRFGSWTAGIVVLLSIGCLCLGSSARGDEAGFRRAMATAVCAAAERVLPSVVTIELIGTADAAEGEVEQDAPTSGVVIDARGFILASSIVVRRTAVSILVVLPDGSRHTATVVARDQHRDLVLLKISTDKPLSPLELNNHAELRVGQTTIAVGRYGSDGSPMVSTGILSATGRLDGIALQSDARVSPALYGGPLVDLYGNAIGILIPAVAEGGAEDATSWYDSGIAFAIPSDVIVNKLDRLIEGKDIKKGLIGIVAKSQDPNDDGTEIAAVRTRSPAETAGIKAGDKVLSVNGTQVRRHQEIRQVLGSFDAGEMVKLTLDRDGKEIAVEVTLADSIPPLQPQRMGVIVAEQVSGDEKDQVTSVVVDAIVPDLPADGKLQKGDLILKIGEAEIADTESLRRQLISAEPDKALTVTYQRDGQQASVEITPVSISGGLPERVPPQWTKPVADAWLAEAIKLPDAANLAAYVAPPAGDASASQLGLLVLLLNPGQDAPLEVLKTWTTLARESGVVVCAIAAEDNGRWQPKELEVVANFAAAVLKKAPIDPSAVAVAAAGALQGGKAEAADSMALAVAIAQSKTFFGVAISAETRPPAVRLRENEPSASLQIMLPIGSNDDLPSWTAAVKSAGYPVVLGGKTDGQSLLRWVRLLQSI